MTTDPHEALWLGLAGAAPIVALAYVVVVQTSFQRLSSLVALRRTSKQLNIFGLALTLVSLGVSLWLASRCAYVLLDSFKSLRIHQDSTSPRGDEFVLYRSLGVLFIVLLANGLLSVLITVLEQRATGASSVAVDEAGSD